MTISWYSVIWDYLLIPKKGRTADHENVKSGDACMFSLRAEIENSVMNPWSVLADQVRWSACQLIGTGFVIGRKCYSWPS